MSRRQAVAGKAGRTYKRVATVRNERGLHARAAAKFVTLARRFDAEVTVHKGGHQVSGGSIMGLMMLAAGMDASIEIGARGRQARPAVDALCRLVEAGFEET